MITVSHYITLSAILFSLGLVGVLSRRNLVGVLMGFELMFNAANINFLVFANHLGDQSGVIFALFVIAVAAVEAAIGVALLLTYYRNKGNIDSLEMRDLGA